MSIFDAIIIYLACGAPLAVYTFLQNRESCSKSTLWVKTLLSWAAWPVSAIKVFRHKRHAQAVPEADFATAPLLDAAREKKITKIRKTFESTFFERGETASIYEFREVFDRYVGLSAALIPTDEVGDFRASELHRIAGHKNHAVGSACLNRRNLLRLLKHQSNAREELYRLVTRVAGLLEGLTIANVLALELADVLKDNTAEIDLKRIIAGTPQTEAQSSVNESGRDIWKPAVQQPFSTTRLKINLQAASASTTASTDD